MQSNNTSKINKSVFLIKTKNDLWYDYVFQSFVYKNSLLELLMKLKF